MHPVTRTLVILGVTLIVIGLLWPLIGRWIGRLPGDIVIDRPGFKFYFPIVTCIILSLVGSAIMFLIQHFRK
ncbi:DUF2905 domain-containing protein [Paenibacillus faecalis]|uniref:DUF2905 domain-containing protein n=1 Tax=Paenibacillus faecalis TaxID=2079532 RepID=UPI000D0E9EA6|nr:DUF2905 domain-containing protein [Paenibacillus faecalis]